MLKLYLAFHTGLISFVEALSAVLLCQYRDGRDKNRATLAAGVNSSLNNELILSMTLHYTDVASDLFSIFWWDI